MNELTLAVAGSRKTQSIVDACTVGDRNARRLVITYTISGQRELEIRLGRARLNGNQVTITGWYSFLLQNCIGPYLPLLYPEVRLSGLNFEGNPGRYAKGTSRYFDSSGRAFRMHLSKLARDVMTRSRGAVVDRISRMYDEIYIDEVQDLTGNDLHILEALLKCKHLRIVMVGDVRQSVFDTNPHDQALRQYRGLGMLDWFKQQESSGNLAIHERSDTWRSNQEIATFSDSILPQSSGFPSTISKQDERTGHDGVFAVSEYHAAAYIDEFDPQPLRDSGATAREVDLPFMNFGKVKGLTFDRVIIYPTGPIRKFIQGVDTLPDRSACRLYVGVTRARYSVAFVLPEPQDSGLEVWVP